MDEHAQIGACTAFWVVVRVEFLPWKLIQELGIILGRAFLEYIRAQQRYIDFRTPQMLDRKEQWIYGAISLGDYRDAVRRAFAARSLVAELNDPLVSAGADLVCHLSADDPRTAFNHAFSIASQVRTDSSYASAVVEAVKSAVVAAC